MREKVHLLGVPSYRAPLIFGVQKTTSLFLVLPPTDLKFVILLPTATPLKTTKTGFRWSQVMRAPPPPDLITTALTCPSLNLPGRNILEYVDLSGHTHTHTHFSVEEMGDKKCVC